MLFWVMGVGYEKKTALHSLRLCSKNWNWSVNTGKGVVRWACELNHDRLPVTELLPNKSLANVSHCCHAYRLKWSLDPWAPAENRNLNNWSQKSLWHQRDSSTCCCTWLKIATLGNSWKVGAENCLSQIQGSEMSPELLQYLPFHLYYCGVLTCCHFSLAATADSQTNDAISHFSESLLATLPLWFNLYSKPMLGMTLYYANYFHKILGCERSILPSSHHR